MAKSSSYIVNIESFSDSLVSNVTKVTDIIKIEYVKVRRMKY